MARTTRISADGRTIKTTSSCGCVTFFLFLIVIALPAAEFGAWAVPAYIGLVAVIVLAFIGLFYKGWSQGKQQRVVTPAPPPVYEWQPPTPPTAEAPGTPPS